MWLCIITAFIAASPSMPVLLSGPAEEEEPLMVLRRSACRSGAARDQRPARSHTRRSLQRSPGSAAQRSIANGAPPPQVPQLRGMPQQPGQPSLHAQQHQQHGGSGAPPHSPTPQHRVAIAEARVLAQEAAHLQAQARNFKA